jgi:cobalt-zinc-cadmium efflux system membrane fusion protein
MTQRFWLLAATWLAMSTLQAAGQPLDEAQPPTRGPHGGVLLERDDLAVELQIFEQGIPPEYRAWVTRDGRPVTDGIDLGVTLTRLGGQVDSFEFAYQGDYWRGDGVVTEPHSFDVEVTLTTGGNDYRWRWESHEGRTTIFPDIARRAGIATAEAGPATIERSLTTYGNLTLAPQQTARVHARFPGVATRVNADLGDRVSGGDVLAEVEANESLQPYAIRAPIAGVVIERRISRGEMAGEEPLFRLADLTTLWAELRVFPGQREAVASGQRVRLTTDGIERQSTIRHLLPAPGNAPYTLARAAVDNTDGLLTPGLLVAGDIVVETVAVPLAVDNRALQSFRDWTVVFIQVGDVYEIRPLELGRSDGEMTEVLSGLNPGDRFVVENSYLIKADIEKSGASHDH